MNMELFKPSSSIEIYGEDSSVGLLVAAAEDFSTTDSSTEEPPKNIIRSDKMDWW
jgi:hypothetical protein